MLPGQLLDPAFCASVSVFPFLLYWHLCIVNTSHLCWSADATSCYPPHFYLFLNAFPEHCNKAHRRA